MILAHKIQLIVTEENDKFFRKACGLRRLCYNWGLHEWKRQYKAGLKPRGRKLRDQFTKEVKAITEWMYESPKDVVCHAFEDLQHAFNNFFNKITDYPTFKTKGKSRDSFYLSNDRIQIEGRIVKLPLIGWVSIKECLRYDGKIMSATVSREADKWFISFNVEVGNYHRERIADGEIALDMGLSSVYTDQTGVSVKPLDQSRKEKRRAKYQRRYARNKHTTNDSKRKQKVQQIVRKCYQNEKNERLDFTHKMSHKICSENQAIYIEDIDVSQWQRNFGKSSQRNCIGQLRRQLQYKSQIFGCDFIMIDKWFPSSKMDHKTGEVLDIGLSDRVIYHPDGTSTDRDHNAAINILNEGRRIVATRKNVGLAGPI